MTPAASPTPRPRSGPRGGEDWTAALRAERRLQAAQMGIVAALALVVLAVAALTGRGVVGDLQDYRAAQTTHSSLSGLRTDLGRQETAFWRHRATGGTGFPRENAGTLLSLAWRMQQLSDDGITPATSPAKREAIAATLRDLDALIALAATEGGPVARDSAADRGFLARLGALRSRIRESADIWDAESTRELGAANARVEAGTRRMIALTGATAILAILLGLLTWRLVARSRRRVAAALRAATERLRHLADTDPLTGLSNQRLAHDRLQEAAADAHARGSGLSAIMIDLDHFKAVNDTFGHPAGDLVLVETARRIRASSRAGDLIARIGGEEFLMLLPGTDGATALAVAERVRSAVRTTGYAGEVGRLSASLGVATLHADIDADALLAQADAALYWAKRNGRDAAVMYDAALMGDLSLSNRAREAARADGLAALRALARAIDARDAATQLHSIRVADMAVMVATALGWTPEQTIRLREAGLVHDVGKIGIPDAILLKPTGLTAAERELMKDHARLGARIVSEVLDADQVAWVANHHERWGGGGYPNGVSGLRIPEGARILALADAWDAMTSCRDYTIALTPEEALDECRRCSGTHFWPNAVDALGRLDDAGVLPAGRPSRLTAV